MAQEFRYEDLPFCVLDGSTKDLQLRSFTDKCRRESLLYWQGPDHIFIFEVEQKLQKTNYKNEQRFKDFYQTVYHNSMYSF